MVFDEFFFLVHFMFFDVLECRQKMERKGRRGCSLLKSGTPRPPPHLVWGPAARGQTGLHKLGIGEWDRLATDVALVELKYLFRSRLPQIYDAWFL